jgi:hypothetical protein
LGKTIGFRAACKKYGICRATVVNWVKKEKVKNLVNEEPRSPFDPLHLEMNDKRMEKVSTQSVRLLTEELRRAKLQIEGLQTMIEFPEEKFKIKIRKKAGTKQSRECDKDTQMVSDNVDIVNEEFKKKFSSITEEDKEAGFIYILKSKSDKPEIKEFTNLYKIGFSTIPVEERIKNASQESTDLMAEVQFVTVYKCYNMNTQKLELLLHTFFGASCWSIDVFDKAGARHIPREWFIAPLDIIERAIQIIISGEIINYKFDGEKREIVKK